MTDTEKRITAAEKQISQILAKLEADTGMFVEGIGVNDIEVTTIMDERPQYSRRVIIEMKRIPGTRWEQ